jgi:ABC-type bacteriocin/lantibiotic exporter with double-glycine peptidase domain
MGGPAWPRARGSYALKSRSAWTGRTSLYSLIVGHTFRLQAAVIALGLTLPFLAVIPLDLQAKLIDDAIPGGQVADIVSLAAMYGAIVAVTAAVKFLVTYIRGWIQEIVSRTLRVAIIEAQRHRSPEQAARRLGAVTSAITGEVEDLGGFASEALNTPLIEGGTLLTLVGFIAYSEPRLAAIGVAALALQAALTPLLQARINLLTQKRIKSLRRAGLDVIDATDPLHHNLIVPALYEVRHTYRLRLRMNVLKALLKIINNLIMHAATIAVIGYGGYLVIKGDIGVGLIVAFLTGLRQIDEHWGELLDFYRRYTDARVKFLLVTGTLTPDPPLPG